MEKTDEEKEPVHTRENCAPCRIFDPPWSPPAKGPPAGQPTPFELLNGLFEVLRETGLREARARTMRDEFPRGSRASLHADGWRVKFASERRHFEAERRKWRSYIEAHPELGNAPITARCRHQRTANELPSCWDGEAGVYTREVGDDDDALDGGRAA